MIKKTILFFVSLLLCMPIKAYSQDFSQYLILNDIGTYRPSPGFEFMGKIVGRGPTTFQGGDEASGYYTAYKMTYAGSSGNPSPTVEVRVYQNTQWLLHEVDAEFRNYYGIPGLSYTVKNIDGNTVFVFSSGGRDYRWLSGNKVIIVEYTDLMMEKPEPIEVVKAYLAKHLSTLPAITLQQLRSTENKTKWIKDEMERRLWLCDKWFMALQLRKAEQKDVLEESVKSMGVFLDYREKYYGISAKDEKNLLSNYLMQNNGTGIKAKLSEYKAWWTANKGNPINL